MHNREYPPEAGVYIMKGSDGSILYIGKAKNIKKRLKQHDAAKDSKTIALMEQISEIDTITVFTEKEALILESNLILKHRPKYNIKSKENEKFFRMRFTTGKWPMLKLVRDDKLDQKDFGPYPSAKKARQSLKFLQTLFPLRECSDEEFKRRKRPCILYGLKRCIAPCTSMCTKEEYDLLVKEAKKFLNGDCKSIKRKLLKEISLLNENLEFEKAQELYKSVESIDSLFEKQDVSNSAVKDFDIFSIKVASTKALIVEMNFRNHKLTNLKKYIFHDTLSDEKELLSQFLRLHYRKSWAAPLIILPFELESSLELFFIDTLSRKVEIRAAKKKEEKRLLEMANANIRDIWNRESEQSDIDEIKKKLNLKKPPMNIIAVDVSHSNYKNGVSSVVLFVDLKKDSQKLFKLGSQDDYSAIRETLERYLNKNSEIDLIVVDGGRGQLNIALKVLEEMDIIAVDVISIIKDSHSKSLVTETIVTKDWKIHLDPKDSVLQNIQRMRDLAHQSAINFQRKRELKSSSHSLLTEVRGIGNKKKSLLLHEYKSLKELEKALLEDRVKILTPNERILLLKKLQERPI